MQDKDELHPYTMSCYSKLYEFLPEKLCFPVPKAMSWVL